MAVTGQDSDQLVSVGRVDQPMVRFILTVTVPCQYGYMLYASVWNTESVQQLVRATCVLDKEEVYSESESRLGW